MTDSSHARVASSTYHPQTGRYAIARLDAMLPSTGSDRAIPLKIYYPQGQGPFPVIVFSHGLGASREDYSMLTKFWVGAGYICIHPTHADAFSTPPNRQKLQSAIETMLQDTQGWQQRVRDIVRILDALPQLPQAHPQLQNKFNRDQIGVGGHSYGAYTAQLIGGARIRWPGRDRDRHFADARVKAFLLLSLQGTGQQGLHEQSWNEFTRPMMVMTGSEDRGAGGQGPQWKLQPYQLAPPGHKYGVTLEGAYHASFGLMLSEGRRLGRLGRSDKQEAIAAYIQQASLAFWDATLKEQTPAQTYLDDAILASQSRGVVSISHK